MTEIEAKDLLEKGHSIEELIELLCDKQEQHDIYVNSGFVYPDFEILIKALKTNVIQDVNKDFKKEERSETYKIL